MKRITIGQTRNGYLVVDGEPSRIAGLDELAGQSWSFNSLDGAIAQIRKVLKGWRESERETGDTQGNSD